MDLVGILHMVDMLSSGKHDFNYIYVVGLIVSILIHFWISSVWISSYWFCIDLSSLVFTQCSCFGMVVAGCTKNVGLHHPFLTVCFLSVFTVLSQVHWCCSVFNGTVWFPVLLLVYTYDHDVDWSSCYHVPLVCFFSQVQYCVLFSRDSYGFAILVLLFMDDHGVTWSS